MKVVFMGTPEFAVPSLEALVNEGHDVCLVVTQPDKPRGRGNKFSFSPVKEKALEYSLPVEQPVKIKNDKYFTDKLKNINPDVIVVVAFGQILPGEVLKIPHLGCINVHASLLPKLRGAAPINWAIINGERETGITTMFMDEGLDTGDILLKKNVEIADDENAGELHDKLKSIGASLLIETLDELKKGTIKREPQDSKYATYAPMLDKDTGRIVWSKSAKDIKNIIRGTNPWPVAYSFLKEIKLKIWRADVEHVNGGRPGFVWKVDKDGIHVYTGFGGIIIKEVQAENGKKMDAYSFNLGHPINIGSIFE